MKPEHQELLEKLQARRKVEEQEAMKVADRVLTEDKLAEIWGEVRQARSPAAEPKTEPRTGSKILLFLSWLRESPVRLALPIAATIVIAAVLMWPRGGGGEMVMAARSTGVIERGFGATLPSELQVNLSRATIRLFHGDDALSGSLTPLPNDSTAEELVFTVQASGRDGQGATGTFKGKARFVRSSANATIRTKTDLQRVIVEGDLVVNNLAPQPVSRAYFP